MSRSISQVPTLRRLSRVYRRMLALAVPAALASCQGAADSLAPDAPSEPPAPAAAPEIAPTPDLLGALASNRIVFTSYTANGGSASDIWTMDPQGGTQVRLTSFTGKEWDPSWSYDHKHIAFTRLRNGVTDIFLMDADGTHKHWARSAIYGHGIDMPSWSPDGTHLLVRLMYQGLPCVAKLDLATGNLTLVAPQGVFGQVGYYPFYDPAGTTIYFLDKAFKTIKRFTPGGPLTTVVAAGYINDPSISPDGTRLAYSTTVSATNTEIYVLNLATNVAKRLTYNSAYDYSPTWSPDGTRLAFTRFASGKLQVFTMNSSTGGGVAKITSKTYGTSEPSWSH